MQSKIKSQKSNLPDGKAGLKTVFQNSKSQKLETLLNKTVKKVGEDIENFRFNTAISSMMILVNEMEKLEQVPAVAYALLIRLLAPFAPHITEEIWHNLGPSSAGKQKKSIHLEDWPKYDESKIKEKSFKIAVQGDNKVRAVFEIGEGAAEEEVKKLALEEDRVKKWIKGRRVKKIIYVKSKLVSIVLQK
jgi:leucyl-tRNA synthetase